MGAGRLGLGLLGGGLGRCRDSVQLACVAAGELDADDVGVRRELDDDVGGEVHARDGAGVVVDDERDGGLVGDAVEELEHAGGRGREEGRVVRGREDQGVVSAGCVGLTAVLDGLADGLGSAAYEDGEVGEAGSCER